MFLLTIGRELLMSPGDPAASQRQSVKSGGIHWQK
jgi:hypothetical protein